MAIEIVGIERRAGEFTDEKTGKLVAYDNIFLYGVEPIEVKENCEQRGLTVSTVKVKNDKENIEEVFGFGCAVDFSILQRMVGKKVKVFYPENSKKPSFIMPVDFSLTDLLKASK